MYNRLLTIAIVILFISLAAPHAPAAGSINSKRPYELEWAGRYNDSQKPLIDFESLSDWKSHNHNSVAVFTSSDKKMLWGDFVGKLEYKCTGASPSIELLPPKPVKINEAFDCVSMWIYGNNFLGQDKSTPPVKILLVFKDSAGKSFEVEICREIRWQEWFLCHRRLTPAQVNRVKNGGEFIAIKVLNGYNRGKRVVYFDNLAVFKEKFSQIKFSRRPKRGVTVFPGKSPGVNTGPGKLPFPNRPETILPDPGPDGWKTTCYRNGSNLRFEYHGKDGYLEAGLDLKNSIISTLKMKWGKKGSWIYPASGAGIIFADNGKEVKPDKVALTQLKVAGNRAYAQFKILSGERLFEAVASYWLYGKSLVLDVQCMGEQAVKFQFGKVLGMKNPKLVQLPYYVYGKKTRPAVIASGTKTNPLFFAAHLDWTLSNSSKLWSDNEVKNGIVRCNGGALYLPQNNGKRNNLYERIIFSLAPEFSAVLPNIPNPSSAWRKATSGKVWMSYASGDRERNKALFRFLHRLGIRELIVTDHEKQWRVSHEGYTFRTRFAPDKGGNSGQYKYTRVMCDELNYMYGPYNNFTDIVPTNRHWNYDMVARDEDNQLTMGFVRCYSPKPVRAVEFCEIIPPHIQKEMRFNTGYCDVHTAIPPWRRTDYDARVPGAGTFAGTYYAYGEVLLLQKKVWNGPVSSEGGHHYVYSGLSDGNYAQDQSYFIPQKLPWLVDFDLLKIHPLENNFGMGSIWMFFGKSQLPESEKDFAAAIDRFLAATVAFGHSGFLLMSRGYKYTLRSYYMLQQLQKYYNNSTVTEIRYADSKGRLHPTSVAIANGSYNSSQVVVKYANGCIVAVNGNKQAWFKTKFEGKFINLPPNGYIGWTTDGKLLVYSKNKNGQRVDYAETPAYIFIDGRGKFTRLPKAAADGNAVCRVLPDGWEVIPYNGSDCGFAVNASRAEALDQAGKIIGTAELRRSRGLTYVTPVKGAFSYRLYKAASPVRDDFKIDKLQLFPGQSVFVDGVKATVPVNVKSGSHWWCKIKDRWIDFDIRSVCELKASIKRNRLICDVKLNLSPKGEFTVSALGKTHKYTDKSSKHFQAEFNLPPVNKETLLDFTVKVRAGELACEQTFTASATNNDGIITGLKPGYEQRGVVLPGGKFIAEVKKYRATVHPAQRECGNIAKMSLCLRPPMTNVKAGFTYALLKPITLPQLAGLSFSAEAGRYNKCPQTEELIFKILVKCDGRTQEAGEWKLDKKEWKNIHCDLTPWAGKKIQLILLTGSDKTVAHSYNTFGCWANMRITSSREHLQWSLPELRPQYEPSPAPLPKVDQRLLRQAAKAWIYYQGQDLTECEFVLNGVMLGKVKAANGCVWKDVWSDAVKMELPVKAIAELGLHNKLVIHNPRRDFFKIRNCHLEVQMKDGKRYSSLISADQFTQPGRWRYIAGTGVPFRKNVEINLWFQ